ncbi:hypothetical protein DXK93_11335 [Achromobacter sp. K91]|uniref:Uncharacterized protein n=1 Tax=Alcaligenes xylosoxydans xylosoxydans TaxID=85698 RepID=A0A424WAQ1_ALCXX|nr:MULTISPECIES: hypothetical protein [Achromobacter]MBC9904836.1 hypothetical protein [Achromobacter xylosoxidans]MBD0868753.1 hypothetical protein [Achromobacter xylosoxidans]MDH1300364.1 hypothetical protein [Achromobacter sp. GD03932]QNP87747.1 hypothetical protein IAG39_09660 [Achromobacter xylosoxidans]RIJ04140.1 hypothetical protein DXK93_11335 [Achromobacter sp. K91]
MNIQDFDALAAKLAGVLGAAVSMRYLQGSWPARLSMAASGSLVAYYAAPYLSLLLEIPEGLAGFLTGMFGMAIVSRGWEVVQTVPIGALWQAVIDRVRGRGA